MSVGTVTYRSPAAVAGTTTAPTTAQVSNAVVADVAMGDADAATTITHNLGVSTNGADGAPEISAILLTAGTAPCQPVFAYVNANSISLANSTSAAGSGSTWRVTAKRPHSITK